MIHPNLSSNGITQLYFDTRPSEYVYPKPLRVAQVVILRFHLAKHNLLVLRMPQEQIGYSPSPLLVLLRHHFANAGQCFTAEA